MLLSIVIPSYNHEQFVLSTIRAAAGIDIRDKEIIVIDDGSSDASVSVIREYISTVGSDSNIRLIARENRGLVKTLNEGLSISAGKYFYLVASDDIPIPEGIAALVAKLEANSNLQFVLGNALFMDSEEQCEFKPSYGEAQRHFFSLPYEERQKDMFLRYPHPILLQTAVFRASALRAIDGWREDIISDDFSLFVRMFSQLKTVGIRFACDPEISACFYRRHQTNVSRDLERQFMTIDQMLTVLCPSEWRDAAHLRNSALHAITAVELKKASVGVRLLYSAFVRMGFLRSVRAASSELLEFLRTGIARRRANRTELLLAHESAASILKRQG